MAPDDGMDLSGEHKTYMTFVMAGRGSDLTALRQAKMESRKPGCGGIEWRYN
jgi:hypothetical protein